MPTAAAPLASQYEHEFLMPGAVCCAYAVHVLPSLLIFFILLEEP